MLAPLGTHNQEQLFSANKSAQSPSPSNDGNEIGSDQKDQRVKRLLELEIDIQEDKECLRMAQDKLAQESSKDSSQSIGRSQHSHSHPIQDGKEHQHLRVSDENIHQVVCDLHDCSQHDGEMQEAYQACKIARECICRNSEMVGTVLCAEITQKDDIFEDLSQLYPEQVEYDTELSQCENKGDIAHHSSKCLQEVLLTGKEVCRWEHYCKWLSMRNDDIWVTGSSNIPSHDKRAAYGRYEVFTLPHLFWSEPEFSNWSPRNLTKFWLKFLPAKFTWNGRFQALFVWVQSDPVWSEFHRTVGHS